MQKWMGLVLFGILAVVVESSLLAWPLFVLYTYLQTDLHTKGEIFLLMILGVVLDTLMVRTVGVSSVAVLIFFGVLLFLRKSFSGNLRIEGLWLLFSVFVWNWFLGTGGDYLLLGIAVVAVFLINSQTVGRDLKLR